MPGFTNERIISLINQIASNHAAYEADRAADLVAEHINLFWELGMRRQLALLLQDPEASKSLNALARAAAARVNADSGQA